jgi:hypothetical protein
LAAGRRHPVAGVRLPLEFDTGSEVKSILRGVLALLFVVVVPGLAYSLFISRNLAATAALVIIAAIAVYFGRLFLNNLRGSKGTITAEAVDIEAGRLYGTRLPGPAGRYPIDRFTAVRVERIAPPVEIYGRGQERVSLVGNEGTPDIIVARAEVGTGGTLGRQLAAALQLPFEEYPAPY